MMCSLSTRSIEAVIIVYLIPPGISVDVSENGADFKDATLNATAQFDGPPIELTASHAIFENGQLRLRVSRADVMVARFDGLNGVNQFGI
jgi:hypothetical protein